MATTTALNAKINKVKGEIPSITDSATTTALIDVKNNIPKASHLVKKTNCDDKIKATESEYFTTSDYNKYTNSILDANIESKKIVNKPDIFEKRHWFRWVDKNIGSKTRIKDRKR